MPSSPPAAQGVTHGPFFPECGGVSDETIAEQTRVPGLVNTATNSVGCQWLAGGGILGPHFSFTWYRGSPIGRERKTEELSRTSVEDINIEGHDGFIALGEDPTLGNNLCEIGIQYDDDFIEWSISFDREAVPGPVRRGQGIDPPVDCEREMTRAQCAGSSPAIVAVLAAVTMLVGCSRTVEGTAAKAGLG